MAKKRAAAKGRPQTPLVAPPVQSGSSVDVGTESREDRPSNTPAATAPDAAILLAWPVASIVNLENLIVEEFHAVRTPEGYQASDEMAINVDTGAIAIGKSPEQNKLFVKIPMSVRAARKEATTISKPAVSIECQFVLIYAIPTFEGLTDEQFAAFAHTSGVFNVWPYWRQAVHTASLHLGLPPIVLPTHRVSETKPNSATDAADGRPTAIQAD